MQVDTKKSIFCALAFNAVSWSSDGKPNPCCGTRNFIPPSYKTGSKLSDRINDPVMQSLRRELIEGKYPEVCGLCEEEDTNNRVSMRSIWNEYYKERIGDIENFTEVVDPKDIFSMDINIGNKCNSKCMTCVPASSDLWLEEAEYIFNTRIKVNTNFLMNNNSNVDEILETFPNLRKITFVGGEPTISDKVDYLLQRLIDTGRSKTTRLSYTTNLTGITYDMLKVWESFEAVGLGVSIDGFGKTNEYIRYPFKWNKIDTNLTECLSRANGKTFGLALGLTASLFNCIETHTLLEYWYNKIKDVPFTCGVMIQKATSPNYVDMRILSNVYRERGIEPLQVLRRKIPDDERFHSLLSAIDSMISYLKEPAFNDKKLKQHSLNFVRMSDKFRNRDIRSYLPDLFLELAS